MKRGLVLLAVLACGACGGGAREAAEARASKAPADSGDGMTLKASLPVERMDLPNGLVVALHPEPQTVGVRVNVRYHVGSKDDPPGRAGLAHLVEHLMFRGSRNAKDDFATYIEGMGGELNAYTVRDHTEYNENVPAAQLPRALWLEADRMAYPTSAVDATVFTHERDVVENEWREHYVDLPYGNVEAIARGAVFPESHPYARSTIGDGKQLEAATLEEVRSFVGTYYGPNDATMVIVGSFNPRIVKPLITKYFGSIPPVARPAARKLPAATLAASRTLEVAADVDAPLVAYAWPGPPKHGPGSEALELGLQDVAASLRYRLIVEKKSAVDVDWELDAGHLGSLAMITVHLAKGASVDAAASDIQEYLTKGSRLGRPYRWDRFADERTSKMIAEVSALEDGSGRARRILHDFEYHDAADATQTDLRRYQAVELEDVGVAVEEFLDGAPHVKIVVRPDHAAPRSGKVVASR